MASRYNRRKICRELVADEVECQLLSVLSFGYIAEYAFVYVIELCGKHMYMKFFIPVIFKKGCQHHSAILYEVMVDITYDFNSSHNTQTISK